jgi:hypothetical protein
MAVHILQSSLGMNNRGPNFVHRPNQDGTIDSICPHCFATVATSQWEADLEKAERDHVCSAEELERFKIPPVREGQRDRGRRPPFNRSA